MSTAAQRRKNRSARDSLRPGWMLNSILFCVLLAGIGSCYVWLDTKKKNRAEQIHGMRREIEVFEKLIREADMQINRRLAPENLQARAGKEDLGLKPIDIGPKGRLYRLPEPEPSAPTETPVSAGSLIP